MRAAHAEGGREGRPPPPKDAPAAPREGLQRVPPAQAWGEERRRHPRQLAAASLLPPIGIRAGEPEDGYATPPPLRCGTDDDDDDDDDVYDAVTTQEADNDADADADDDDERRYDNRPDLLLEQPTLRRSASEPARVPPGRERRRGPLLSPKRHKKRRAGAAGPWGSLSPQSAPAAAAPATVTADYRAYAESANYKARRGSWPRIARRSPKLSPKKTAPPSPPSHLTLSPSSDPAPMRLGSPYASPQRSPRPPPAEPFPAELTPPLTPSAAGIDALPTIDEDKEGADVDEVLLRAVARAAGVRPFVPNFSLGPAAAAVDASRLQATRTCLLKCAAPGAGAAGRP